MIVVSMLTPPPQYDKIKDLVYSSETFNSNEVNYQKKIDLILTVVVSFVCIYQILVLVKHAFVTIVHISICMYVLVKIVKNMTALSVVLSADVAIVNQIEIGKSL